jgi:hypothetical protein
MPIWYQALTFYVWRSRHHRVAPDERIAVSTSWTEKLNTYNARQKSLPTPIYSRKQVRKARLILVIVVLVLTGLVLLVVFTKSGGTNYTGSWDNPSAPNANSAATAQAKASCEVAWSLEKGGPSTYGVSHSDYITSCVRAAGG